MYIYKITNKLNNKIYIGQTYNKTIYDRFARHIGEANPHHPSLIDRAIYKYGKDNFVIEQIDEASSLDELNNKEKYWIKYYNSTDRTIGYNLTSGGNGGNTYLNKTDKEMQQIKEKISKSNSGKNNGMSVAIKALNVNTNEILYFDTLHDACVYFNHKQKNTFVKYCKHRAICLWRKEWTFAYENDNFNINLPTEYDKSLNHGTKVKLIDLKTKEEKMFNSMQKLCGHLNISYKDLNFVDNECILDTTYKIIKL